MTRRILPLLLVAAIVCGWVVFQRRGAAPLVVYCAHDSIYAEGILREFTRHTGIAVSARYDTEATKSLGLVELLVREKDAPRCDVFWNNELLGMLDLKERGLLAPYMGPGWERIPPRFREAEGHWAGFAARLRVLIINTNVGDAEPAVRLDKGVLALIDPSRMAVSKPLYGTMLTHYSVLWQEWGGAKVRAWHREWRERGVRELNGNAAVKAAVAAGACDFGYTDTDDFFDAKDDGKPVEMRPVRLEGGGTICIPNTVAVIRGTRREADARRLVDFLLSAETEMALARSKSRQIPLGPVAEDQVPAEVRELMRWAADGVPLADLRDARAQCLAWLRAEYIR